jgi:hypothetical protein
MFWRCIDRLARERDGTRELAALQGLLGRTHALRCGIRQTELAPGSLQSGAFSATRR